VLACLVADFVFQFIHGAAAVAAAVAVDATPGRGFIENEHPTNVEIPPPPRVCMYEHPP